MNIYMAPMEGVGGFVYRNAFDKFYGPIDGYITPFVGKGSLMNRERRDIDPANNHVSHLIPQIMGGNADGFLKVAEDVAALGYAECNVNLGCPSGTVTGRGRGSGMLKDPEGLDKFCSEIFEKCPMKLSVKTRIGSDSPDEWSAVLEVLKKYPWQSVTIHPRTRLELYQGPIHMDAFELAYNTLECPLFYNGEIHTVNDVREIEEQFPRLEGVMIGRGFLSTPWLACELKGKERPDGKTMVAWHRELVEGYSQYLSGEKSMVCKLKDLWNFMGAGFPGEEKKLKAMKKTGHLSDFQMLAENILKSQL